MDEFKSVTKPRCVTIVKCVHFICLTVTLDVNFTHCFRNSKAGLIKLQPFKVWQQQLLWARAALFKSMRLLRSTRILAWSHIAMWDSPLVFSSADPYDYCGSSWYNAQHVADTAPYSTLQVVNCHPGISLSFLSQRKSHCVVHCTIVRGQD